MIGKRRIIGILTGMVITVCLFTFPVNAATYTYDNLNRLTSVTYENGQKITYTYDAVGNILSVINTEGESSETWTNWNTSLQKGSKDFLTVTFNKEVEPSSVINTTNIFAATDESGNNKMDGISVTLVSGNAKQVRVSPPANGWQTGGTYYLFISKQVQCTSASGAKILENGIRMRFNVTQ